ncbi:MAG: hypothetical protein Q8920_15485 [Bacillota bacterium]|nr:hypothetical protein [Bacillota bacterium]
MDKNRIRSRKREPAVAPGYNDEKFGENATREDKKTGNYTRITRVFLDENDPTHK